MEHKKAAFYALLLLVGSSTADITSKTLPYIMVNENLPSSLTDCLLLNYTIPSHLKPSLGCASICTANPDCLLYCMKGTECRLFKAWVTGRWAGASNSLFGFSSCYTAWHYDQDLSPQALISMSSSYSPSHAIDQGTNGYYCTQYESCSLTYAENSPWYQVDLQATVTVRYLIVKPREDGDGFADVEVRFGNSVSSTFNPLLAVHLGPTPEKGVFLTLTPSQPMQGRYLSFKAIGSYVALGICELQIIGN